MILHLHMGYFITLAVYKFFFFLCRVAPKTSEGYAIRYHTMLSFHFIMIVKMCLQLSGNNSGLFHFSSASGSGGGPSGSNSDSSQR